MNPLRILYHWWTLMKWILKYDLHTFDQTLQSFLQYIPIIMYMVHTLLCFVVVRSRLILPILFSVASLAMEQWYKCTHTILPVKQSYRIRVNKSHESTIIAHITTTKQSTTNKICISYGIYSIVSCGPFYLHGLTCITAWISNYIHYKVWNEITNPSPNFNSATVEVWEWVSNFISHFTGYVITYLWWNLSQSLLIKRGPREMVFVLQEDHKNFVSFKKQSSLEYHLSHAVSIMVWQVAQYLRLGR